MENKERPILFSTDMVVSILEDRKTKTRRMTGLAEINEHPDWYWPSEVNLFDRKGRFCNKFYSAKGNKVVACPYGQPGDVLWVRENGWIHNNYQPGLNDTDIVIGGNLFFQADQLQGFNDKGWVREHYSFFPSIHMYKVFARIWLQITDIRVERLNEITEQDAIMEGISATRQFKEFSLYKDYHHPQDRGQDFTQAWISFSTLWETINGRGSWVHNPWVWVISFKVLSTTGRPSTITSGVESKPCIAGRLKSSPSGKVQEQVTDAHLLPGNGEGKEVTHA